MAAQVINTRYEVTEPLPALDRAPLVVSKARDRVENRVVTLEVLPADRVGRGRPGRAAFLDAAEEARALEHPNIARTYEAGETEETGDLYVVSEYLQGITLRERIRRVAPFALTVTADIAVAVAEALDYAHRQGVLHGDLRPQTVFLSPEGRIRVLDFAFGRVAATLAGLPSPYSAPELTPGAPATIAGDIYALGVVLYEMLTGTTPLLGPASSGTSPRDLNPGVPPALDGIVQKALQADPAQRYRNVALILADLQAVREALRTGRSLSWSPLDGAKRSPRQPVDATMVGARPAGVAGAGPLTAAADEMEEERAVPFEREPSNWLGKVLAVLFGVLVLGVIFLTWYFSKMIAIPSDVVVPNLVGKTMTDARTIARQQHFSLQEGSSDYSDQWPEDQVYQQDPLPGRAIKSGQVVTVLRSLGPRLLTVPNLVGMVQDRAGVALKDADLPAGDVGEDYSDTVPKGVVLSQKPSGDQKVERNTPVSYVVSKGRQPPDSPADVQASATAPDRVEIHWRTPARAETYTVVRILDGDEKVIAKGVSDTRLTDTGLQPDTTYSYTVTAANPGGDSPPSDPAVATTPARVSAPPVADFGVSAPAGSDTADASAGAPSADTPARMRQFTIQFKVPRRPRGSHHVQFEVQDTTGTNLVYDESRDPGDEITAPVTAFGNKITFFIYIDGKLAKKQTL